MTRSLEDAIFELLSDKPPGASIAPEQAARAADPDLWRQRLAQVRATAIGLARQGRLEITRKGRVADPETLKGVYRLRLPVGADVEVSEPDEA
jgi:hypothetical protein